MLNPRVFRQVIFALDVVQNGFENLFLIGNFQTVCEEYFEM